MTSRQDAGEASVPSSTPSRNRDLRPLFAPRSVAVIGASADPSKWGNALARGALRGAHRRTVFLVNRAGGEILGHRAYPSHGDLPEAPELVVISGARGRPRLDVSAAARAVAAVSRAAAACPAVAELEVNPLLVLPEGVVGLDARVLLGS
jgi:predicted CoA-binding protein